MSFEKEYRQFLREMRIRRAFLTSSEFIISNTDESVEILGLVQEDMENLIREVISLVYDYILAEDLHLLESDDKEDYLEYQKHNQALQKIHNALEEKLQKLNIYLTQYPIPEKMFVLKTDEFFIDRVAEVNKVITRHKRLKFVPELSFWLELVYQNIEKYNRIIDVFNERNRLVKKTVPSYFHSRLPVLEKIKNISWRPERQ